MMKLSCFSILLALGLFCSRTAAAQQQPAPQTAVLNHIAVYVTELKRSADFYTSVLKLQLMEEPFKDGKHVWYTLGPAGQLHLIQGALQPVKPNKNEHLCFSVVSIDEFIAGLNQQKIHYEDWGGGANKITLRVDGVKQIYFQDPDGHWIEINDERKGK